MSEETAEAPTPANVRATFVMKRQSRDVLRMIAARYGVSQSEVMNNAPFLFLAVAEESLKKRRESLAALEAGVRDTLAKLKQVPDHLCPFFATNYIEMFVDLETTSLERRQLHGPDEAMIDEFYLRSPTIDGSASPFTRTVVSKLEEVGAGKAASAYRQLFKGEVDEDEGDTFTDADEKARMEELLADLELDDLLSLPPSDGDGASRHVARCKWHLSMPGEEMELGSGGEVLAAFLRQLHDHEPERFEHVRAAGIRGRIRPLMTQDREKLYPGRPDLAEEFALQFSPGWWVGTNYSTYDVLRLLKAATREAGWTWNIDVSLKVNGHTPGELPATLDH